MVIATFKIFFSFQTWGRPRVCTKINVTKPRIIFHIYSISFQRV